MRRIVIAAVAALVFSGAALADDLIAVKSGVSVPQTLDKLQKLVSDAGFIIVARVPHSEAAKGAGLTLRPTELMIFGKPQSGTPIMVCNQRAAIDLPLHAIAWQDEAGQVWLGMNDPKALKQKYAEKQPELKFCAVQVQKVKAEPEPAAAQTTRRSLELLDVVQQAGPR